MKYAKKTLNIRVPDFGTVRIQKGQPVKERYAKHADDGDLTTRKPKSTTPAETADTPTD